MHKDAHTVSLFDDIKNIKVAELRKDEKGTHVHLVATLREEPEGRIDPESPALRLHLTNGVNHHYCPLMYQKEPEIADTTTEMLVAIDEGLDKRKANKKATTAKEE